MECYDTQQLDAFGRLRVSNPYTLFDSQNRYFVNDKFYSVGSNITYNSNESTVYITIPTGATSNAYRESKYVFSYQPGKSLLIMNTFVFNQSKTNLGQRVGYYNSLNGIFIEMSDAVYIVKRNNGVDTKISQANWNGNKLYQLDLTKAQILWTDVEWLGVGNVRVGFIIDGKFIVCHTFRHANYSSGVYMTTANLPIRYEIFNTGVTQSESTLKQICSTVISEGGYDPKVPTYSQLNSNVAVGFPTLTVAGKYYPLVSIRLNASTLDAIVIVKKIDLLVQTKDSVRWALFVNSNLTGTSWVSHATSNVTQVDISSTDMSGGKEISSGLLLSQGTVSFDASSFNIQLGRNNYVSDTITLAASGFSASAQVGALLGWIEI